MGAMTLDPQDNNAALTAAVLRALNTTPEKAAKFAGLLAAQGVTIAQPETPVVDDFDWDDSPGEVLDVEFINLAAQVEREARLLDLAREAAQYPHPPAHLHERMNRLLDERPVQSAAFLASQNYTGGKEDRA